MIELNYIRKKQHATAKRQYTHTLLLNNEINHLFAAIEEVHIRDWIVEVRPQ